VEPITPPPEPARHGWAELLTLVGAIRRIAYNETMPPDDQMRRIRDAFLDYDHPEAATTPDPAPAQDGPHPRGWCGPLVIRAARSVGQTRRPGHGIRTSASC
jgi:hypothetical protein